VLMRNRGATVLVTAGTLSMRCTGEKEVRQ
jgi:hypothetical protein